MFKRLKGILADSHGATVVEYGLICSLVVLAMLAALIGLADTTTGIWNNVTAKVVSAQ